MPSACQPWHAARGFVRATLGSLGMELGGQLSNPPASLQKVLELAAPST